MAQTITFRMMLPLLKLRRHLFPQPAIQIGAAQLANELLTPTGALGSEVVSSFLHAPRVDFAWSSGEQLFFVAVSGPRPARRHLSACVASGRQPGRSGRGQPARR